MAKAPYKLPNVFVGCPYGGKFKFQLFKSALDRLPFKWFYADTSLNTKHLLGILRSYIKAADFCLFDISTWNPNVALEIGIAEGEDVEYYILLNRRLTKGVPADIQGIQRIEYTAYGHKKEDLGPQLAKYLVKTHTHPKKIWDALAGENRELKYDLALAFLAHLRDHARLTHEDVVRFSKGTYLWKEAQREVLGVLEDLGLVGAANSAKGAVSKRNLWKDDIRVG
jgi:hypothetical protein